MRFITLLLLALVFVTLVHAKKYSCKYETSYSLDNGLYTSVFDLCQYDRELTACSGNFCFVFNPFSELSQPPGCNILEKKRGQCYGSEERYPPEYSTYSTYGDLIEYDLKDDSAAENDIEATIRFICDSDAEPGTPSKTEISMYTKPTVSYKGYVYALVYVKEACRDQATNGSLNPLWKVVGLIGMLCIIPPLIICVVVAVVALLALSGCLCGGAMCCGGLGLGASKLSGKRKPQSNELQAQGVGMHQPLLGNTAGGQPNFFAHQTTTVAPLPAPEGTAMPSKPGTQLRGPNDLQVFKRADGAVFVLIDGKLRAVPKGITDGGAFLHTFGIPNEASFMNGQVELYSMGAPLPEFFQAVHCAGVNGVYFLMDDPSAPGVQMKRLIASSAEFAAYRLTLEKVATIDGQQFSTVPDGPVIQF